jgi:hypothetical protein
MQYNKKTGGDMKREEGAILFEIWLMMVGLGASRMCGEVFTRK